MPFFVSSSDKRSCEALPGIDELGTFCDTCGFGNCQDKDEDEKLDRRNKILDLQESGLDISYRCVRCRECLNSVNLDWEKKKRTCILLLCSIKRDFLTSNEDRALKILDAQCRRYIKDEQTKADILAALQKLMDKEYIKFIEDLPIS